MKTTGLDMASLIPAGTTVTATSWHVPGDYHVGAPHPDQASALAEAIAELQAKLDRHNQMYPNPDTRVPHPETVTIELRWSFQMPEGAKMDVAVTRLTHDTLDQANAHLNRLRMFAPAQ